ncbi:TrkA Cterminal domain containing protein [Acanthamoeba castellanii str. Neff]|uniref:TrkA Cterminal domain containing protein n=1 Tax=Acanthamoeba castellanii (strain ATCC 30010 / Neff) TaxID=1257118 RepID=L8GF72_ACACF|nr:TrkA Cterminal domain containing protein [Acanthamoeba castellanii str. Neff]ELR11725.1 TrkA Cterminal domain containing protein [Acanthamoeba castellanii str. Neff]
MEELGARGGPSPPPSAQDEEAMKRMIDAGEDEVNRDRRSTATDGSQRRGSGRKHHTCHNKHRKRSKSHRRKRKSREDRDLEAGRGERREGSFDRAREGDEDGEWSPGEAGQLTPKHIFYNYYSTDVTWEEHEESLEGGKWSVRAKKAALKFAVGHKVELAIAALCLFILFLLRISAWQELKWQGWYTVFVVCAAFFMLVKNVAPNDVVMVFVTTLLLIPGIITPSEALTGFSSVGILTIAVLFVVAAGIAETGSIGLLSEWVLGKTTSVFVAQLRLMLPLSFLSAFTNNTPLTAIMIPVVPRHGNQAIEDDDSSVIGYVGLPIVLVGLTYMLLISPFLLPDRESPMDELLSHPREYTITVIVEHNSSIDGKTVGAVGLNAVDGLILVNLIRRGVDNPNVSAETTLNSGDQLIFAGDVEKLVDLFMISGIKPTNQDDKIVHPSINKVLVEAVVSPTGSLVNRTIGEADFGKRYGAAVLSVGREGEKIHSHARLASFRLRGGDTLLLVCRPDLASGQHHVDDPATAGPDSGGDFITVSRVGGSSGGKMGVDYERMCLAPVIAAIMILVSTFELTSLLTASLCAAFIMIITGCISVEKAVAATNFRLIAMIASSFGMAMACEKTGVAQILAHDLVSIFMPAGSFGLLYGVYLSTALLTSLLNNASAAALMVPIVFSFQSSLVTGVNVKAFVYCIMVGASADFSTPIGYQTNLMVWGPGGYKFMDYTKVGLPLQALLSLISVGIVYWQFA